MANELTCECGGRTFYTETVETIVTLEPDRTVLARNEDKEPLEWYCCDCGAVYYGQDPIAVKCTRAYDGLFASSECEGRRWAMSPKPGNLRATAHPKQHEWYGDIPEFEQVVPAPRLPARKANTDEMFHLLKKAARRYWDACRHARELTEEVLEAREAGFMP